MDIDCGVPQGSVLGPLLFLIYVNDLPNNLSTAQCIQFADDTTLYHSSSDIEELYRVMNHELQILTDWFKANKLSLNASKTNYIIFSKSRLPTDNHDNSYNLQIDGTIIQRVPYTKFLGIFIDERLRWDAHINHIQKKIKSGIYALNLCKTYMASGTLRMLYFSLIHPHLLYGGMFWGSTYKKHIHCITVLQKKAIRLITKSSYNAHTAPLYKQTNILKLDDIYKVLLAKHMYRYYNKSLPPPLLELYNLNQTIHNHQTRQSQLVHVKPTKIDLVLRSFIHTAPETWSSIPDEIKKATSLKSFNRLIKKYFLSKY